RPGAAGTPRICLSMRISPLKLRLFTKSCEESAMSLSSASAVASEPTEAVLPSSNPLQRLLEGRLPGRFGCEEPRPNGSLIDWFRRVVTLGPRNKIRSRITQDLFGQVRIDPEVRTALLRLFSDSADEVMLARDWLAGARLSDEQLRQLGLPVADHGDTV